MRIVVTYFFDCKRVKEVWRKLGMEHIRDMLQLCGPGKEVIEKIWILQEKEQRKIWVFLRRWWSAQNKAVNRERMASTYAVEYLITC
jgi:hypothetical protein